MKVADLSTDELKELGDLAFAHRSDVQDYFFKEVNNMPSTLKEAINSLKILKKPTKLRGKVSDELLEKYSGIIPKGKTSTESIRELRGLAFGKMKK